MKLKIAGFGGSAQHAAIEQLAFDSPQSLSDYDGILFDPAAFGAGLVVTNPAAMAKFGEVIARRQKELAAFLSQKSAVLVCYLRPARSSPFNDYSFSHPLRLESGQPLPLAKIQAGVGFKYKLCQVDEPARAYFSILQGKLKIEAHFEGISVPHPGIVLATDPFNQVVAVTYNFAGGGKIYFLPIPNVGKEVGRIGSAVVSLVRAYYGGSLDTSEPRVGQVDRCSNGRPVRCGDIQTRDSSYSTTGRDWSARSAAR